MTANLPITVAIPTYRREGVLLDTLDYLFALDPAPAEILVLDQTEQHEPNTETRLRNLHESGSIRWFRLNTPSIPQAMNRGLLEAREQLVLFLDDDIRPEPALIASHYAAHQSSSDILVAGRVIQPWQEGIDFLADEPFRFCSPRSAWINEFMGGNFSVQRTSALALGGFDENFVRVAYRFEAEFAHRFRTAGGRIYFEPAACIHHLKADGGGTRAFGKLLTTWKPDHAVGPYYYSLRTRNHGRWLIDFAIYPIRAVITRHHLRHPWWIPLSLVAEVRGMVWALLLALRGPKLMQSEKR